jgi:hypothetical protein
MLLLALAFPPAVEVERVLALVNGAPILVSDVDLAEVGGLVPREAKESDEAHRAVVAEALVLLQLRWQDLESAGVVSRIQADLDAAWQAVVTRAGGAEALRARLAGIGLEENHLRELVRRAAIVQAYVGARFAPFVRPTTQEVEKTWRSELAPKLAAAGQPVPDLKEVRAQVEAIVRERKLDEEIDRWTHELETRGEVVRYFR